MYGLIMPRPPEVPGKPAKNKVSVLINDQMLAHIDKVRGRRSRSAYIRHAIRNLAATEPKK